MRQLQVSLKTLARAPLISSSHCQHMNLLNCVAQLSARCQISWNVSHLFVRSGVHSLNTQRRIRYSAALFSSRLEWTSCLATQGAKSSSTSRPADLHPLTATTFVSMHSSKHCAAGSRLAVWVRTRSTLPVSTKKMSPKDSCNLQCVAPPTELCSLQILF